MADPLQRLVRRSSTDASPTLEGTHIISRQREPLVFQTLICEPTMPIGFNPCRIIGLDDVNRLDLLRKLDADLTFPS